MQSANIAVTGQQPKFALEADQVEDDSLSTIQFFTPGLMGWAIASGATFGAATNLVVWRKNGLLRRLRLAPVPTWAVVLARIAVSVAIAAVQAAIFIGVGVALFGLQLTGSWPMIIPLLTAGTLSFMAIGLLAGAVAKSEEAAVGIANFVVLPMAFLSGSFFPLDGAPGWVTAVSEILPLKHLNEGMLDTMVRGEGPVVGADADRHPAGLRRRRLGGRQPRLPLGRLTSETAQVVGVVVGAARAGVGASAASAGRRPAPSARGRRAATAAGRWRSAGSPRTRSAWGCSAPAPGASRPGRTMRRRTGRDR